MISFGMPLAYAGLEEEDHCAGNHSSNDVEDCDWCDIMPVDLSE